MWQSADVKHIFDERQIATKYLQTNYYILIDPYTIIDPYTTCTPSLDTNSVRVTAAMWSRCFTPAIDNCTPFIGNTHLDDVSESSVRRSEPVRVSHLV